MYKKLISVVLISVMTLILTTMMVLSITACHSDNGSEQSSDISNNAVSKIVEELHRNDNEKTTTAIPTDATQQKTQNSYFDKLVTTEVGEKIKTGVDSYLSDDWYKLYEDEENVYLFYGDYLENSKLSNIYLKKLKLEKKDDLKLLQVTKVMQMIC